MSDSVSVKANGTGRNNATRRRERSLHLQLAKGFSRRTTIHGLSHMHHSKTLTRRIFWLVIFLLGFIATIIHLTFHTMQFLESPTVVSMDHEGAEFEFPDVTICSQTPTTGRLYERDTAKFPNVQYGFTAQDYLMYPIYNQTYTQHSLSYKEEIQLHKRLIQHQFASTPTKHKSFAYNELVIKCAYHKGDCRQNLTLVQSPYYLNCYTFEPIERYIKTTRPEDGLILLLYTGNSHKNRLKPLDENATIHSDSRPSNRIREEDNDWFSRILLPEHEPAGIKIVVHERGSYPALRSAGFIVGVGQFSEVELGMIQEYKLNKATSPCLKDREPKVWLLTSVDEQGWPKYREFNAEPGDCTYALQQKDLFAECGCTSHRIPLQRDHGLFHTIDRGDQVGWCYNSTSLFLDLGLGWDVTSRMHDPATIVELSRRTIAASEANRRLVDQYRQRVRCHDRMLARFSDPHYNSYKPCVGGGAKGSKEKYACQRNQYSSVHSAASWPRPSDIQEILEDNILPALRRPGGNGTNSTDSQYQELAHDIFDFDAGGRWSAKATLIGRNFVKLQLHPVEVLVNVHREEPAYSIWEALGELGGVIGLWLGVSFLGVIEVLEFLLDLVLASRQGQGLRQTDGVAASKDQHQAIARSTEDIDDQELESLALKYKLPDEETNLQEASDTDGQDDN